MIKKNILKRLSAYVIDLFIIYFIAFLLSNSQLNPQYDKYKKAYNEYYNSDSATIYNEFNKTLTSDYEDNTISEAEYNNLLKKYSQYEAIIVKKYQDKKITATEITEIKTYASDLYYEQYEKASYNYDKNGTFYYIVTIVLTLLYFGLFPLLTHGQTLGYKLFKIKMVNKENGEVTILNTLIRATVLYTIPFVITKVIFSLCLSMSSYYDANYILSMIQAIFEWALIIIILINKEEKGLQDILAKTKVISVNDKPEVEVIDKKKLS